MSWICFFFSFRCFPPAVFGEALMEAGMIHVRRRPAKVRASGPGCARVLPHRAAFGTTIRRGAEVVAAGGTEARAGTRATSVCTTSSPEWNRSDEQQRQPERDADSPSAA